MGTTGALDGGDVIDAGVGHPATAERLSRKLLACFACPNPSPEVIAPFKHAMNFRQVYATILDN
jgi:hypothetical protein